MSESLQHICEQKCPKIQLRGPTQTARVWYERLAERLIQPDRKLSRSISPMRNFRVQQGCEFGIGRVHLDHPIHQTRNQPVEWLACALADLPLEHLVDLFDMTLVQCDKHGLLVRKVLVDRANAYARSFSNAVRSNCRRTAAFQQTDHGAENSVYSLLRPALSGPASPIRTPHRLLHKKKSIHKCEHSFNIAIADPRRRRFLDTTECE
jgi:hypothetical protein